MSGKTLAIALAFWGTCSAAPSLVASQSVQARQDPVLNAIAAAVGMPALESVVLPTGYREVRIRGEQSMVCCEARPMLRVVEGGGDVRGSLWLFRTLVLRPGNPAARDDERCEPLGEQHICVRPWNLSSGDWVAVAARLEELGAWTLSEPCNRPTVVKLADGSVSVAVGVVGDSGLLSVQRRVGPSLTTFMCIGPGYERETDGLRANELYKYLMGFNGAIPSEPLRIAR